MDKAIEIKRRAQRCILNGDLDGALAEYEKLVAGADPDPYYCVLLADLLYKKGNPVDAQKRYLEAIDGYEKNGLFKNGIAVCKKMSRLSLAAVDVPGKLGRLYALDGLATEAGIAYVQHAELLVAHDRFDEARASLAKACELGPDVGRPHERMAELELLVGDEAAAARAWAAAAACYERAGLQADARRCRSRAGRADEEVVEATPQASHPPQSLGVTLGFGPEGMGEEEEADGAPAAEEVSSPALDYGLIDPADPTSTTRRPAADPKSLENVPQISPEISRFGSQMFDGPEPPGISEPIEAATAKHVEEKPAVPAQSPLALAGLNPDDYDVEESAPPAAAEAAAEPSAPPPAAPQPAAVAPAAADEPVDQPADDALEAEFSDAANAALERLGGGATPARPGLQPSPAAEPAAAAAPVAAAPDANEKTGEGESAEDAGLAAVSLLLAEAQTQFHAGERQAAAVALVRAAQTYDQLGRLDSAAAIYRSLGHSPDVSLQLMMLWLKNCQRRDDRREAALVACDLGDRALNDGDVPGARDWFERAHSYDPENELATRRLAHVERLSTSGGVATAEAEAPAPAEAADESAPGAVAGGLRFRSDRPEPVVTDLGSLINEFRRAIEPELASDPQGQYDLAMSYREMGLLEEAIASFRAAAADPGFRLRASELAGRCLLDLGRFEEAADALRSALDAPDLRPSAAIDLRYQLGLALEAAGRGSEALAEFERVYAARASYPDAAMKIRLLRKTAEAA